jgi:hypothetical protein
VLWRCEEAKNLNLDDKVIETLLYSNKPISPCLEVSTFFDLLCQISGVYSPFLQMCIINKSMINAGKSN